MSILIISVLHIGNLKSILTAWLKLFFSRSVFVFIAFAALILFFVYTPTYLTNKAVETVVGGPAKIEHTGLTLTQFKSTVGEPRLAFSIAGILLLSAIGFAKWKKPAGLPAYHGIFLFSWTLVIAVISLYPAWIGLSIPSGRVANYGAYPLAIIAAAVF